MKKIIFPIVLLLLVVGCTQTTSTTTNTTEDNKLVIYTYDSLSADYGLLPLITEKFKTANDVEMSIISFSDTGAMMKQLLLDGVNTEADIVMGLDNVNYPKIKSEQLFQSYQPNRADEISDDLWLDDSYLATPFDYGYVGFVYDSNELEFNSAISLEDLASDTYKDKIIIEQAGLSSPGTQLLLWSHTALDVNDVNTFWKDMEETVLTVAPDWSTAYYSMFLEGEAPIVLSYLTSPAYHIDQEETYQYKAVPISEGYLRQVELIGITKTSNSVATAQAFIDYILTDEVQDQITVTQWMFPVLGNSTNWPEAYNEIINPSDNEILTISNEDIEANYQTWLDEWNETFAIE